MKLPESELEVMLVLWKKSPLKTPEIMEELKDKGWSISTLQALLQRLEDKGAVVKTMEGRMKVYRPVLSQNQYSKEQSSQILKRFYHGSVASFVAHFAESESLSDEELREIQEIINRKGK